MRNRNQAAVFKDFLKDTSVLLSGKVLSIGLGLISTPIISRIYEPEDYGLFGLYFSIVSLFGTAFTGGYDKALLLPVSKRLFYAGSFLVFYLLLILSGILALLTFVFQDFLNNKFLVTNDLYFTLYIPVGVFLFGLITTLPSWQLRFRQFKSSSIIEVSGRLSTRLLQLILGFIFGSSISFLVGADMISKFFIALSRFLVGIRHEMGAWCIYLRWRFVRIFIKEYQDFPKYVLPVNWLSVLNNQFPLLVIAFVYTSESVGQYAMAMGLITIPIQLLSGSIQPVILQRVTESRNLNEAKGLILQVIKWIFFLVSVPSLIAIFYSDTLLPLLLGNNWVISGKIGGIISIYLLPFLISSLLIPVLRVNRKEKFLFLFNLMSFVFESGLFLLLSQFYGLIVSLYILSIIRCLLYFIFIIWVFKIIKIPLLNIFKATVLYMILFTIFFVLT